MVVAGDDGARVRRVELIVLHVRSLDSLEVLSLLLLLARVVVTTRLACLLSPLRVVRVSLPVAARNDRPHDQHLGGL